MVITVSVNSEICFRRNRMRQTQKIVLNVVNSYMAQNNTHITSLKEMEMNRKQK